MGSMLPYKQPLEVTFAITSKHSALFCLLLLTQITVSCLWMWFAREEFQMDVSTGTGN
jgi:hypothetical protein